MEGEKRKNDLVLFLAHDLKTPLTSIVAYLSMLDGYPKMPEEERKKYIHIALEKSNRLGELINEFFDITRYNLQEYRAGVGEDQLDYDAGADCRRTLWRTSGKKAYL